MQYTIRDIPKRIDEAIRRKAKAEGKSLNQIAVEAMTAGLGLGGRPVLHDDLDFMLNTWVDDPVFDEVRRQHDQIDPEMWK